MNIKTTLKASVAAAALFAVAAPAHAGTISNSNDTASVTLSGHFNKAVMWASNGENARVGSVDNDNSMTRGRIIAKGKVNEAVAITGTVEWGMRQSGTSASITPESSSIGTDGMEGSGSFFNLRHSYVKLAHKQFGSLSIGHTSAANDGITENNQTGAADIVYGGNTVSGNGINLRLSSQASNTIAKSTTVGSFITNPAEGGREDTIRYDSPSFGGAALHASFSNNQTSGVGATWSGKMGGFKIDAGYAYANTSANSTSLKGAHGGSIAIGHDSGLNLRVSGGVGATKASGRDHKWNFSVGGGYKADLIAAGKTNFAVDWTRFENATTDADKMDLISVGVEQDTDAGVKFYLGYQHFDASQGAVDYDNASTVMAGTKFYF